MRFKIFPKSIKFISSGAFQLFPGGLVVSIKGCGVYGQVYIWFDLYCSFDVSRFDRGQFLEWELEEDKEEVGLRSDYVA